MPSKKTPSVKKPAAKAKPAPKPAARKAASPAPKPASASAKPPQAAKAGAPVALERQRRVLPDDERLPAAAPAAAATPATDVTWSDALATDPADEILGDLEGDAVEDDEDDEFGAGGGDDEDWK